MKGNLRNIVVLLLLMTAAVMTWSLEREPTRPNAVFLPEMYYSVPFDPQSPNPNFADGATAREPLKGTIPRGFLPLFYDTTEAAVRAVWELRNPFSRESGDDAERGAAVFRTFCQPCHGATGSGDGTITKYGFPPPPSFSAQNVLGLRDGQIFHTITFGKKNMPALASQIPIDDRWKAILHVRSLQGAALIQQKNPPTGKGE
ncbi:MAG: cytochrome c [Bacteroidota bacterium]